jgi:predicted RND superfamily exporter protein
MPSRRIAPKTKLTKALVIGIAVVFFWRGAWGIMDLYLLPNNLTHSYIASLVLGVIILYSSHYLVKELLGE